MVAQELSTPASTTTRTRNMAVHQSGRTSAAAHTAWRRLLICAVSVAATLCCSFVPGVVSPMPPYFPVERGRRFIESCKQDSLENHPPTLLDNAPVMEEAFEIVREAFPWLDEVLKRDFLDVPSELEEPFKLELGSRDVERYLAASRPNLRENAARCLWDIKKKDFDEMAKALLRHTDLNRNRNRNRNRTLKAGMALNSFIREDDLKHEMKTEFRRGYVTASSEKQERFSAKPSSVSRDLETWVQGSVKVGSQADTFEVKLTVHPSVRRDDPEGSILCSLATYQKDGNGEFKRMTEWFQIKDLDYANSTGKRGEGGKASAYFKYITPDKNILDQELKDSIYITKSHKGKSLAEGGSFAKGALGLAQMSSNDMVLDLKSEKRQSPLDISGKPIDPTLRPTENAVLEVTDKGGEEEYPRWDHISIHRNNGFANRKFKTFEIGRAYTLFSTDNPNMPFYKKPATDQSSEAARQKGEYHARLHIHQEYTVYKVPNRIKINIGFLVDEFGGWIGSINSPIYFNLERIVRPALPGGEDETIEVRKHFAYKTAEHKSVVHMSHITRDSFKVGSFVYRTKDFPHCNIKGFTFDQNNAGGREPTLRRVRLQDYIEDYAPQKNKGNRDGDLSEPSSVNDGKGQKSSLLGTTLFDGGLLFFGIITVFVLLTASLESSRKGKKVRTIQSRVVDSSKNIFEGQ